MSTTDDTRQRSVAENPWIDAAQIRRCAEACRNLQKQAERAPTPTEWFDWVPRHLDRLADSLEAAVRAVAEVSGE